MDDYPKLINVGGIGITVANEAEEAQWRTPPSAPAPEPVRDAPTPKTKRSPVAKKGTKKK